MIDFEKLPECARGPLERWILHGIHPGSGYQQILSDRLSTAVLAIDDDTLFQLPRIMRWLMAYAPASCWGSAENFDSWMRIRRAA